MLYRGGGLCIPQLALEYKNISQLGNAVKQLVFFDDRFRYPVASLPHRGESLLSMGVCPGLL